MPPLQYHRHLTQELERGPTRDIRARAVPIVVPGGSKYTEVVRSMSILETERLRIRPLTVDDDAFVLRLLNEPSFVENIGDREVRTHDDARKYIENGPKASHEAHGFGLDCVELKPSGEPIGICGLLKRDVLDDVDVGYAFLPEFWSRGYAREAVAAVLADAKQGLGLTRIAAVVSSNNESSIRVLERLGFRYEKMVTLSAGEPEGRFYVCDLWLNEPLRQDTR